MIKLENTEVLGWEHAIRGMRNPKNSWKKSDSDYGCEVVRGSHEFCKECDNAMISGCNRILCSEREPEFVLGSNDHDLMMRLAKGGPVHAKYRRMIVVYVDITAPLYWWKEFDTYQVGVVKNSCSTMHKIAAKEFTLEDFSTEHLKDEEDGWIRDEKGQLWCSACTHMETTVNLLNAYRYQYLKTKDKKYWWQMIQLLPSSYNQRRTVMLNYEVLANIYKSRRNHKLDEWHTLCDWIVDLPYSEIIIEKPEEKKDLKGIPICYEIMEEAKRRVYDELKENWPTACDLCNEHGCGDSDEEVCKKCQFYKYSKWRNQ